MLAYLWGKWTIWWTRWGKPATIRKQAPTRRRLVPRLELLEDRCVPSATIAEFPALTASSSPFGITAGPDGNVWFTENQANQIGMINPTTHAISEFSIPTANSGPVGITAGPDDTIWFTENQANQIGMINPTTHAISEFSIPTASSGPVGITAGPDGNIWFTEFSGNQIGEINPTTHAVTEFAIPTATSDPLGITAGPDGNLWFAESNGNNIGTINPTTHTITEYAIPLGSSQPTEITAGPNGNMWFAENAGNEIGEINTTNHTFSSFFIPTASSAPYGITAGADGNIWFTEAAANQIGEVNLATGVVTETPLPTASASPAAIVAGPGGTLWFTEANGNQIGEVVASPTITTAPVSQTIVAGQTATFTTAAVGFPTPTVQWEVSTNAGATFTPLTNAGVYSGVTTDTLTITDASTAMNGYEYEAVFSNGVSPTPSTATAAVILTVKSPLSITPTHPQGIAGVSFNQTLSVVGSTTPFNVFSVPANSFSPGTTGLTFSDITTNPTSGTIVISGTPTAAGIATFNVTVANTGGDSLTQSIAITIRAPLSIATASLPPGTAGMNYNHAITVAGGVLPYTTFTVTNFNAGTTGLTAGEVTALPGNGVFNVDGTPTAAGTATFTVNVTDADGTTVTKNFTVAVNPPLAITPALPAGTAGTIYKQTLTVTGGVPYTSLTVSGFSAGTTGLTIGNVSTNPAAGTVTINGTPTAAGTVTFTVNVVDAIGAVLNKTYTATINPALTITPSLPAGTAGASYHQTLTVTGGSKPYTTFTITGFSAGTTGLSTAALTLNAAAGTIVINGTPSAAGTVAFTVNATDAAGSHLTRGYSVTINAAPTIGNLTTTQWTTGTSGFTGALTINGGTGPFSLASAAGLPLGLTAALTGTTIHITGTPTTTGIYAGSVTIHDTAGAAVTKTFSLTINAPPALGNPTATQWTKGMSGFVSSLTVTGGTGGLSIASATGLPTGLTAALIGNTIRITGTPTVAGTFAGSVIIHDAAGAAVARTFTLTINAPPTLGTLTRTQWTAGKSGFTGIIPLAAGTGPFTIASASGLPTGLTAVLSGNAIRFTGTPSAAQTFAAGSITLHDAAGASVTKTFSITIDPPLLITTTSLPASTLGVLYTATVKAKGGTGAVAFAITAGSLPPGLKLSSTGGITGVSRGSGSFAVTITATDAVGATFSEKYTLSIAL